MITEWLFLLDPLSRSSYISYVVILRRLVKDLYLNYFIIFARFLQMELLASLVYFKIMFEFIAAVSSNVSKEIFVRGV